MNQIIFLLMLILLTFMLPLFFRNIEGYENYKLENIISNIPDSETKVLVQDTYPPIGKNKISNDTASSIWWHYPVFTLGSYKQITNNIRYPNNPDEGTCMPASMCGSLYKEKHLASNYVTPLPPVIGDKTRIGYFTTDKQLIDSLPFRSDGPNILY